MSHVSTRAESAPRESCAQTPEMCPVCERVVGSAAFSRCCSRHCEEAACRSASLNAILADPAASIVSRAYARAELRHLAVAIRAAA